MCTHLSIKTSLFEYVISKRRPTMGVMVYYQRPFEIIKCVGAVFWVETPRGFSSACNSLNSILKVRRHINIPNYFGGLPLTDRIENHKHKIQYVQ